MPSNFIIRDQCTGREFPCVDGQSILNAMEVSGDCIVRVGCRGGGCGLCRIDVIYGQFRCGKMSRRHAPLNSIAKGKVLACRVYPESNLIINIPPYGGHVNKENLI